MQKGDSGSTSVPFASLMKAGEGFQISPTESQAAGFSSYLVARFANLQNANLAVPNQKKEK